MQKVKAEVRGAGVIILNVLRAFNLIGLLSFMVSSWAMIVISGMKGHFSFFDTLSHFWFFMIALALFVSETGVFQAYFDRNWPVLGAGHPFAWLGVVMLIIGTEVMAYLNNTVYSAKNLGTPIWRLVLASGILNITFGILNIVASIFFRDRRNHVTARDIRKDGKLAAMAAPSGKTYYTAGNYSEEDEQPVIFKSEKAAPAAEKVSPFSRMAKLLGGGDKKKKPVVSSPRPAPASVVDDVDVDLERGPSRGSRHDSRDSPVIPGIKRPPTAMHPMHGFRTARYSNSYSEANMDRFTDGGRI